MTDKLNKTLLKIVEKNQNCFKGFLKRCLYDSRKFTFNFVNYDVFLLSRNTKEYSPYPHFQLNFINCLINFGFN